MLTLSTCDVIEFLYLLGGKGRHGNSPEDLRNIFPRPQNAEGVGEVSGGSQEQRSSQTGTGTRTFSFNAEELRVSLLGSRVISAVFDEHTQLWLHFMCDV